MYISPKQKLSDREIGLLTKVASRFENDMRKNGFSIGVIKKLNFKTNRVRIATPKQKIYTNGKYPVYVGFKFEGLKREEPYVDGQYLGLRNPLVEVDFLYFNEEEMSKGLNLKKEAILGGVGTFGEIEFRVLNPGFKVVKDAYKLCYGIENWLKENGTAVKLRLFTSFYYPHIINTGNNSP